jgi:hypothetical protein
MDDRTITLPVSMNGRYKYRPRSVWAAAAVALGLTGAALLLSACSTVGAIPGVLITPTNPAPVLTPAPVAPPAPSAPSATTDPTAYLATFTTRLAGNNEVPQNFSMGTGTVDALLDTRTGLLRWKLSYSNLTGAPVMGHFHGPAEIGANAGVALAFPMPLSASYEGRATLTSQQMADMRAGKWYANLHTAKYPDGEVRGQMIERR